MKRPLIDGWTSDQEAQALVEITRGRRVLEVGTYKGFGAVLMAQGGARVWAVDWHRGDPDLGQIDTLCSWWTNVRRHHAEDQVVGLVGRSETVLPLLRPHAFEVVFIDGYHALEAVTRDIELSRPLLESGGRWAFHDYDRRVWPGVVRAVDELRRAENLRLELHGSLAILHPRQ